MSSAMDPFKQAQPNHEIAECRKRISPDPSLEADHRKIAEQCDALRLDEPQIIIPNKSVHFKHVIGEICAFPWASLTCEEMADVAGAYYFFSIQFRESLAEARRLYPADADLRRLEAEECDTDNLSPWPGVAAAGERMDHDEFIRRTLALLPRMATKIAASDAIGRHYLAATRAQASEARAACLASYEDGGLERVFRSMLQFPRWNDNALLQAFRHFLSEHVRFDAGSEESHGALCRNIPFDDRILPLWQSFRDLLVETVPTISRIS
jgi:hypothetical protein